MFVLIIQKFENVSIKSPGIHKCLIYLFLGLPALFRLRRYKKSGHLYIRISTQVKKKAQ